jgi:signal transduction histidine kinase
MGFFNLFNAPPLISSILLLVLGIFVFHKNNKSPSNFLFFIICIATVFWQFSFFILFSIHNPALADFFVRICYAGIILLPTLFLHFICLFSSRNQKILNTFDKYLLYFFYFSALFFEIILFSSNYFIDGYRLYFWGFYPKAGIIHPVFLFILTLAVIRMIYVLYSEIKNTKKIFDSNKYHQLKYFFFALIFFILSSIDFLPNYGIGLFYPLGFLLILIFLGIIAYTIVAYRLMDIKFVLRNSSVYLTSLILTLVPALFLKYLFDNFFPQYSYWIDSVIVIFSISVFPLFKERIYRFANKYFFSSLYDSKTVIRNLSDRLSTTLATTTIYKAIAESLGSALHMKAICFITRGFKEKDFIIPYNNGFTLPTNLKQDELYSLIFKDYVAQNKVLVLDELKNDKSKQAKDIVRTLGKVGIEILVPLNVKDKPIGAIALSAKESKDNYNGEDLDLLKIIGSQTAISLENALLYEETKKFNVKLIKEVEKATQDLKDANEELKKLDRAKSDFISIASHQLRTPLTVIKGYVSMMLEGSFGELNQKVDENLYKVYESNERLIHLVEDLLNISRIESGRLQFNFEETDLTAMAESVIEELSASAKKKKLYLHFTPPKTVLPKINLDAEKLRQVFMNLVDNAVKYTKRGGVTVTMEKVGEKISCCVSDTGMGISADDLPNLFKRFSRGADTSLVHTEGTGLGLYVGKMMIEAHQGRIWAESAGVNRGSKFCFELPLIIKQPTQAAPKKVI